MTPAASIYDLPRYYDIAFGWDPEPEVALIQRAIAEHARRPADGALHLLEPACGSGRLLAALSLAGHKVVGYDKGQAMAAYAARRLAACGLAEHAQVVRADMACAAFAPVFDAAVNLISSISHLLDDVALVAHLRQTAASLRPGGVYVVQFGGIWDPDGTYETSTWTAEREGTRVHSDWSVDAELPDSRIRRLRCRMTIDDPAHGAGSRIEHNEVLAVRLWTDADWRGLVDAAGCFAHCGGYDEQHERISADARLTPDHGNATVVLRVTD